MRLDSDKLYQPSSDDKQVGAKIQNKSDSQYFLLPIFIPTKGVFVSTTALVDTGATHNFIDSKLTRVSNYKLDDTTSWEGSAVHSFFAHKLKKAKIICSGSVIFTDKFWAVDNLIYPIILGVQW